MSDADNHQLLEQAQIMQQEMQMLASQKGALTMELSEVKRALDELENAEEKSAYKISGSIIIKKDIDSIKKELAEKRELLDVRIESIEKREKKINETMNGIREKFSSQKT